MSPRWFAPMLILLLAVAGWAGKAQAQDVHGKTESAPVARAATELVSQIRMVVDAVKSANAPEQHKRSTSDANADAEHARARRVRERGVVPFARTVYMLVKGSFDPRRSDPDDPKNLFLQVRPRSRGGYVRCEFRF